MNENVSRFAEDAVVLSLSVHRIGVNQRLEDDEFEAQDADKDMVTATKKLFADCEELNAVNSHLYQTKKYIEARCLPSTFRGGIYFVKANAIETLDDYLRERTRELKPLVEAFVAVLDQRIEEAKSKLGRLGETARWPTAAKVRRRFRIEWRWLAFETPERLKGFSRSLYDREREKAQAQIAEARDAAIALLREQMKKLVDHMVERLTPGDDGKPKKFKGGTVENLASFLQTYDLRSAGDAELDGVVKRAASLLDGVDAQLIRDEEGVRAAVTNGFSKLKAGLDKLVQDRPRRMIDFEDEQ
jgi:hypothetical protein